MTGESIVRTVGKRLVQASLAVGGSVVLVAAAAGTATAGTFYNGVCEAGEFCLYKGAGRVGPLVDFFGSVPDYGDEPPTCYQWVQGDCVKNNARSAWNRTGDTVTVYYNPGYTGPPTDVFAPNHAGNLVGTYLHNGSHRVTFTG